MSLFVSLVLARWIHFTALFLLFGAPLFWLCVADAPVAPMKRFDLAAWQKMGLRLTAIVAAISGVDWLAGSIGNMSGDVGDAFDMGILKLFFFATPFGPVSIFRLLLFAGLVVVTLLPLPRRGLLLSLCLIAGTLLVTQAWLGHAAGGGAGLYGSVMILTYSLHVLAGAAWIGGLAALLLAMTLQGGRPADQKSLGTHVILSRYSLLALIAVAVIVISGIVNSLFRIGGAGALLWTPYVEVLAAKLCAVALMLALAYFNRFIAMPRLTMVPAQSIVRLRWSVTAELLLGVVVLGLAAVLGITAPPA
jgi:putative copper resistance protein D